MSYIPPIKKYVNIIKGKKYTQKIIHHIVCYASINPGVKEIMKTPDENSNLRKPPRHLFFAIVYPS